MVKVINRQDMYGRSSGIKSCYDIDKLNVMELLFFKYSEYLGKNIKKGNDINPVGMESIKSILELV